MRLDDVPRETRATLDAYVQFLLEENRQQNLIAASTVATIWDRHIADSLQLLPLGASGQWLDVGSGPGLPGLVLAIAAPQCEMILVEPRARRAAFLRSTAEQLGLRNTTVIAAKVEAVPTLRAQTITARAVAPLATLFNLCSRHAAPGCIWLLPKGRRAAEEVAAARRTWQARFELVPSLTDPDASIVVARDVQRKGRG